MRDRECRRCGWKIPDGIFGLVMPARLTRLGFCCPQAMAMAMANEHARLIAIEPYAISTESQIRLLFLRFGHRLDNR